MPTINSKLVPNCHCGKCSYQPDHCHFSVIVLGSTRSVPTLRSMSLPRNSAVPALADLAHFWQHFGTDVHVAAVWGFASASTGRLGTLLAAIWHWCLHSASEAVEAANRAIQLCCGWGVWGLLKGVKIGLRFALRAFVFKIQAFESFNFFQELFIWFQCDEIIIYYSSSLNLMLLQRNKA